MSSLKLFWGRHARGEGEVTGGSSLYDLWSNSQARFGHISELVDVMHTSNKLLIGSRFHSHLMPTGGQEEEFGRGRAEAHSSEPTAAALGSGFTSKHSRSTSSAISAWTASAIAHSTAFRRRLGRRNCEWLIKAVMVYLTTASTWIPVVTRGSSSGSLVWLGGGRPAPRCLGRVTGALRPPFAHMEPQLAPTEVFVWAD